MKFHTLICILVVTAVGQSCAHAQEARPKPPSQLNGKSITITYTETRRAKPEEGGEIATRKVPFKLIVYASTEGNLFNRLFAGRSGKSSDQTRGTKDGTQFSERDIVFDKQKMTVSNTFHSGKGLRTIEATFDEAFAKCTASVVTTIQGEYAKRRLITGGHELVYSATASEISCKLVSGNELQTN